MRSYSPIIAVTAGDPCGIGPEVVLKVLAAGRPAGIRLIVIGDVTVFERTARALRLSLPRWTVVEPEGLAIAAETRLAFLDLGHPWRFTPGGSSDRAGRASLAYLEAALQLWRRGLVTGLVTAPVTKSAIARVRRGFHGQTEFLAQALGNPAVAMMFVSPRLRVALLTRHVPIREVPARVSSPLVRQTVSVVADGLRRHFGIRRPRLAVCGLNPHAGEDGLFGDEERRILLPVLRELKRARIEISGPFAADGLFAQPPGNHDAVLCWYHDQGLIPFKLLARDEGCQLTLGLPIVRTSPDHGSALDIAGRGIANPGSMRYAIELAAQLTRRVHSP